MEIMRNRYEGTEYSPDETGRTDMRVIGTDTALSVHIAQIYPDLPADMSCVTWESTAPALYGVFVPVSNAVLSISEPYARNQPAGEAGIFDTVSYPYYRFKELNTLCVEKNAYRIYGLPVRAYWHEAETYMCEDMAKVLSEAAAMEDTDARNRYITDYCSRMQEQAFEDSGRLLKQQYDEERKKSRDPRGPGRAQADRPDEGDARRDSIPLFSVCGCTFGRGSLPRDRRCRGLRACRSRGSSRDIQKKSILNNASGQ
jgi:dipeptidase